jgi:hypothetical protein
MVSGVISTGHRHVLANLRSVHAISEAENLRRLAEPMVVGDP